MTQLTGSSDSGDGVLGISQATGKAGVAGVNEDSGLGGGNGVFGRGSGNGVFGISTATTTAGGAGVVGTCDTNDGVRGFSKSPKHSGVVGTNNDGGIGVLGQVSGANAAVAGVSSSTGPGVVGRSTQGEGVRGESSSKHGGLVGVNTGGGPAGFFEGDVEVTGDVRLRNADCAEHFDVADMTAAEPGTVMVLGENGVLHQSQQAYDKRVAGVISGAGDYKPGILLDKQQTQSSRLPIALLGKVYCKVDSQYGCIEVGDLLTTSPTPGHAMKVDDPLRAFGAVIGKALRTSTIGEGLIPILIALQ